MMLHKNLLKVHSKSNRLQNTFCVNYLTEKLINQCTLEVVSKSTVQRRKGHKLERFGYHGMKRIWLRPATCSLLSHDVHR